MIKKLGKLTPSQFENLVFDLLQAAGFRQITWRTPGADGGRDIECVFHQPDATGHVDVQVWYVECKRYSSSVDWPTVWAKIAYAENAKAQYLLLATNNNPSPNCETEISKWNVSGRSLRIRTWRGYDFDRILSVYKHVAVKYGLLDTQIDQHAGLNGLVLYLMKITQSAYTTNAFGLTAVRDMEAAAAVSELISLRMDQLATYGRTVAAVHTEGALDFDWLEWDRPAQEWVTTEMRAFLASYRQIVASDDIMARVTDTGIMFTPKAARSVLNQTNLATLAEVALWSDVELQVLDQTSGTITVVRRT